MAACRAWFALTLQALLIGPLEAYLVGDSSVPGRYSVKEYFDACHSQIVPLPLPDACLGGTIHCIEQRALCDISEFRRSCCTRPVQYLVPFNSFFPGPKLCLLEIPRMHRGE